MDCKNKETLYVTEDNSEINDFCNKFNDRNYYTDLEIRKYKDDYYSGNMVGICRVKDRKNGKPLKNSDNKEIILKIEPRFPGLSVVDMLNYIIKYDDEFPKYLAKQKIRLNEKDREVEDLSENELFNFFTDEPPIEIDDETAKKNSILTVTLYLYLLKSICMKPLLGKMVKHQENLVGKIKGKILFNKNIKYNTVQGRDDRIYCEYSKFTTDILENQILKAALIKAKRFMENYFGSTMSISNKYADEIAFCTHALRNISTKQIRNKDCLSVSFTGLYSYYKPVIAAAKLILEGISINTSTGSLKVSNLITPYTISMEKLFEFYVRCFIKKEVINEVGNGIELDSFDSMESVFKKDEEKKNLYISGNLKPDIIFKKRIRVGEEKFNYVIFDVKYRDFKVGTSRRDARLQLLSYALMYNCKDVGLIFPGNPNESISDKKIDIINNSRELNYHQLMLNKDSIKENEYSENNLFTQKISEIVKTSLG